MKQLFHRFIKHETVATLCTTMKHATMSFQYIIFFFLTSLLGNVTDQQALLSFKASITRDPNDMLSSWNHSVDFCEWQGVTCSRKRQRVTALNLSSQKLDGTLSPHIGNLSFLRLLYLHENNFHGSIPNQLGRLFHLQYLILANNSFQGEFPMNLSHCSDIRTISMKRNILRGKLPTDFTFWSKLIGFNVNSNHFTGSIPSSIGNISSLRILDLGSNYLTGSIPLEFAHLFKLEYLQIPDNNLVGTVPRQLYDISSLSAISLAKNELEGMLPADLGLTLPNLQIFFAGRNNFSGPFPPSITNASNLVRFDIATNYISGPLPNSFGSLSSLEWLNLGGNILGRSQPPGGLGFMGSLVNSTCLNLLNIAENGLTGELPNSIANLSTTLDHLYFANNFISGSIPEEIGKFLNMTVLSLYQNMLTGSIPESICKLSKLKRLLLFDNKISGVIPACISNITGLLSLHLSSNMLRGNIPTPLFNIASLEELSLDNNHLSSVIPEEILGLSPHCRVLYLHQNLLTGKLPSNIGSLKHLVELTLSDNKLSGNIPASLGDCVMLELLLMDSNLFNGTIPSSFKALQSLAFLDLSDNNMSGNIPQFLGVFHLIQFLNLSYNKLGGEVPIKGLFSNVSTFSIVGNFQLCGGIQELQLPACHVSISKTNKKEFPLRIIPLIVILPLATLLAFFTFLFYRIRKTKEKNVGMSILHDNQYPRFSYQDLLVATINFSKDNFLGKGRYGSVYKGMLESLQHIVAVKVLDVEVPGAHKNFLAECKTLRSIRHRNIIKILTACSSTDFKGNDFKALILEFMANGRLDNWLHPSPSYPWNERNLTIFQRLNIVIDVALAVDYLHHQCHTKILHCDIKPSNILLDEEFVAHVSDFGLAKLFLSGTGDINQAQTGSTAVQGTVGYVPPEYGMGGKVSAEGDVYSYGVLLLEMLSGKRPTSSSILRDNANNLHDYVRKALPDRVMDIADPRIVLQQDDCGSTADESVMNSSISNRMEVFALIFEVGVLCSVEMPRDRIDIRVAIKKLHVARERDLCSTDCNIRKSKNLFLTRENLLNVTRSYLSISS